MSESKSSAAAGADTIELRVGKVLNEFLDRRARGEAEPEAELLARHPDLADDLRPLLGMISGLRPAAARIGSLVAQGTLQKSSDPRYPAELGAYKIVNFIGRGGMGIVLKAYEESLNRTVALKVLRPELTDDRTAVARFEREAKAVAGLHHPNIVTVHAVGEERGVHFLAMEHIAGPTLADVIRDGQLPRTATDKQSPFLRSARSLSVPHEMVRNIFRQLLSGLACAHEAGLIHRDIKSSNILLDGWPTDGWPTSLEVGESNTLESMSPTAKATGHPSPTPGAPGMGHPPGTLNSVVVKIADFGLARMISSQTRVTLPDSVLGTPEYMSPEQARGESAEGVIDHRTDLYSAGVVLYEMLTGRTPFKADTPSAVIHQILHDEPADPRTITEGADPHLASLALRLMAKRPEDRFDSASEALAALDAEVRVGSLAHRRRFRQRAVTGLIVLALATVAAWAIWWVAMRPPRIASVERDPDNHRSVRVRYGNNTTPQRFPAIFPPDGDDIRFATYLDLNGRGKQAVVVGTAMSRDGRNLFAFDPRGREIWHTRLASDGRQWPGSLEDAPWVCKAFATGNLDDQPGDELVVAAHESGEAPARVSIITPSSDWEVRPTFWHIGNITELVIEPNFFGKGKPAIIARGYYNELANLGYLDVKDYTLLADYERVPAVMILDPDPERMNGLGPRRNGMIPDIQPARPHAYALLNVAPNASIMRRLGIAEYSVLAEIAPLDPLPRDNEGKPWQMLISVGRIDPQASDSGRDPGGAKFRVDRNLDLVSVKPLQGEQVGSSYEGWQASWRQRWRPIIQDGKYVNEAAGWND